MLVLPEGVDLTLGFALCRRAGKTLGDGLSPALVGEARVRSVTWIIWLVTMTSWISTTATSTSDRTRAQISELGDLMQERGTSLRQSGNGIGHGNLSYRAYQIRSVHAPPFRVQNSVHKYVAPPGLIPPKTGLLNPATLSFSNVIDCYPRP